LFGSMMVTSMALIGHLDVLGRGGTAGAAADDDDLLALAEGDVGQADGADRRDSAGGLDEITSIHGHVAFPPARVSFVVVVVVVVVAGAFTAEVGVGGVEGV
jgi:hypothetical protein